MRKHSFSGYGLRFVSEFDELENYISGAKDNLHGADLIRLAKNKYLSIKDMKDFVEAHVPEYLVDNFDIQNTFDCLEHLEELMRDDSSKLHEVDASWDDLELELKDNWGPIKQSILQDRTNPNTLLIY